MTCPEVCGQKLEKSLVALIPNPSPDLGLSFPSLLLYFTVDNLTLSTNPQALILLPK
jgi:hypothetical protein